MPDVSTEADVSSAPDCCRRYRPAARHAEPVDTSPSHVGIRCVTRSQT